MWLRRSRCSTAAVVNAANAAEFAAVENINGALVGGASLDAGSFLAVAVAFAGA